MWTCYIRFRVTDRDRFEQMKRFIFDFQAEKDKQNEATIEDEKWFSYFDQELLKKNFWWPTEEESQKYWKLWKALTPEQRLTDPRMKFPWDFASWLDALYHGEYCFLSCDLHEDGIGKLQYGTWSWPYGSVDAIRQIMAVFDFEIVEEET